MKNINYKIIILIVISLLCIIFVYNDYFLYKTPILKVTSVETIKEEEALDEETYIQNITGKIVNGEYKGKELKTTNIFNKSLVYDDKIEKHSELFVELTKDGDSILSIKNIKRDKYLAILIVIFIDLMIIIGGIKGLKTLGSLLLNVGITTGAILLYMKHYMSINMLLLYFAVSLLFIVTSLYITNGKSKKTLAAIVSSIVSLLLSFGIAFIILKIYENEMYIWIMDYIEAVYDYYNYVYVSVLLCGLGAIMDISITISSSLSELISKNPKIDKMTLLKSGKVISKDIVGTMINVMLFTCYTSIIPTVVLATKNGMSLANAISFYGSLELTIVLCTCIGIILAIPISLLISVFILGDNKKDGGRK